jgi:MFS family permease
MALHFSKVVFSLIGGDLSDKFGRKKMIFAGWIVYAIVYAGFAFVNSPWQAWVLFIIYGAYFGLTEGVEKALVADLVEPEKRGTAYGFYNLAYSITVFPASIIFGALWTQFNAATAFLVSAAISIIAAALLLSIRTKRE